MPIIPDFNAQSGQSSGPDSGQNDGAGLPILALPPGADPGLAQNGPYPGGPSQGPSQGSPIVRRLAHGVLTMDDQDERRRLVRQEALFNAQANQVMDELANLSGPAALPDQSGQGGILNLAQERLSDLSEKATDQFQGAYGQALRDKLASLTAFRLNAAARRQAQERGLDFNRAWAESSGQYLDTVRQAGGEQNTVFKSLHDGLDSLETLFSHAMTRDANGQALETGDAAARRGAFVAAMGETSVLSALDQNPDLARANLDHFAPHLPEGRADILSGLIDSGAAALRADAAHAHLSTLPPDRQQALIADMADPDLRQRLTDMSQAAERQKSGRTAQAAHEVERGYAQRVRQALADPGQADLPTPREIMADRTLDADGRKRLLAQVLDRRDPVAGRGQETARLDLLTKALADPERRSRADLLVKGRAAGVDAEGLQRVIDLHQEAKDNPDLGPALDILGQESRGLFRDRAAAGRFQEDLAAWAAHQRQTQGRPASLADLTERGRTLLRAKARGVWTAGSRK